MRSKMLRVGLVLFELVWFGAFLPGHNRGQITIPGYDRQTNNSCCSENRLVVSPTVKPSACRTDSTSDKKDDPYKKVASCAICYIVATLQTPEPIDTEVIKCDRIEILRTLTPARVICKQKMLAHRDRGPPLIWPFI